MGQVSFTVEFNDDGTAIIRLPEGKTQQVDASKVADLTEKLGKALGPIKERHIGRMDHGVHVHDDGQIHQDH
jgi:hypothetical protein